MPAGRPRTVSMPPEKMIELGKEMIEWVKENDPVHLCEFYCIEKGWTDDEWDTMHVCPEFFPYYKQALAIIGIKYLKEDTGIESNIKQRWIRHYFKDLRQEENDTFKLKAGVIADAVTSPADLKEETLKGLIKQADRLEKDSR